MVRRTPGIRTLAGRLLLVLACLAAGVAGTAAQAQLTARLSSPQIDETQTLELTIRSDSRDVEGSPDLSGINKDFEVLTTRKNSQYRVINGNVQAWTDWIIALRPLRTGTLTVPALSYRGESSDPLELKVVPLDPAIKKQMSNRVFFETSTEPENPFVQAQTIFIRRLLYAEGTQIYGEMPDTPVIEDAVVLSLGNATSSTVSRNNQRYGMIEQRYAIFPERSGELVVPGAAVSGSVRMNVKGRLKRSGVRVTAAPSTINVRPIPADYPKDVPWLPATSVELLEAWDKSPPVFRQGEPLTQTLIIRSDAATGSIIPPLDYEIPDSHFRSYPEQPKIADNQRPSGLIGTRSQTWSLIPTAGGPVTLPRVSLTWFNTVSETVETAFLSAKSLNIAGSNSATATPPADLAEPEAETEPLTAEPATANNTPASERRLFSVVPVLLVLLLIAALIWRFGHLVPVAAIKRALTPTWMHLKDSRENLMTALRDAPAEQLVPALDECVSDHAGAGKPVSQQTRQALLGRIEESLYAKTPRPLDREALLELAQSLFNQQQAVTGTDLLPSLYPEVR